MLMFVVKDEDCFGVSSDFLGEAYYSLADKASTSAEMNIQQTQQIHLHLSEPSDFGKRAIIYENGNWKDHNVLKVPLRM